MKRILLSLLFVILISFLVLPKDAYGGDSLTPTQEYVQYIQDIRLKIAFVFPFIMGSVSFLFFAIFFHVMHIRSTTFTYILYATISTIVLFLAFTPIYYVISPSTDSLINFYDDPFPGGAFSTLLVTGLSGTHPIGWFGGLVAYSLPYLLFKKMFPSSKEKALKVVFISIIFHAIIGSLLIYALGSFFLTIEPFMGDMYRY